MKDESWNRLTRAAEELRASSRSRGMDTRSALAGGALGLLLSSRGGRSLLGKAIKYGTVAGLGALAWQRSQQERNIGHDDASRRVGVDAADKTTTPSGAPRGDL
jgi:uncharacterized membrane protein YebE (DUF533 family)